MSGGRVPICMAGMRETAAVGHNLFPLMELRDNRLLFLLQLTAKPRHPFQCKACGHVEWHTAERAVELGLVLIPLAPEEAR